MLYMRIVRTSKRILKESWHIGGWHRWLSGLVGKRLSEGTAHTHFQAEILHIQQLRHLYDTAGDSGTAEELDALAGALGDPDTRVCVFGEFDAGKSTLINSLLGAHILKMNMRPTTAVPVEIRWSEADSLAAISNDGQNTPVTREVFWKHQTLDINSRAQEGLKRLLVYSSRPLLRHLAIIDTPGILDHNTQTLRARREAANADIVIAVMSARRPWSITEREQTGGWLAGTLEKPVLVVVNGLNLVAKAHHDELEKLLNQKAPLTANSLPPALKRPFFMVDALPALRWLLLREGRKPRDHFHQLVKILMHLRGSGADEIKLAVRRRRLSALANELMRQNDSVLAAEHEGYQKAVAEHQQQQKDYREAETRSQNRLRDYAERLAGERASIRHAADRFRNGGARFPTGFLSQSDPARKYNQKIEHVFVSAIQEIENAANESLKRLSHLSASGASFRISFGKSYTLNIPGDPPPPQGNELGAAIMGFFRKMTGGKSENEAADAAHRRHLLVHCDGIVDSLQSLALELFDRETTALRTQLEAELNGVRACAPTALPLAPELAARLSIAEILPMLGANIPAGIDGHSDNGSQSGEGKAVSC